MQDAKKIGQIADDWEPFEDGLFVREHGSCRDETIFAVAAGQQQQDPAISSENEGGAVLTTFNDEWITALQPNQEQISDILRRVSPGENEQQEDDDEDGISPTSVRSILLDLAGGTLDEDDDDKAAVAPPIILLDTTTAPSPPPSLLRCCSFPSLLSERRRLTSIPEQHPPGCSTTSGGTGDDLLLPASSSSAGPLKESRSFDDVRTDTLPIFKESRRLFEEKKGELLGESTAGFGPMLETAGDNFDDVQLTEPVEDWDESYIETVQENEKSASFDIETDEGESVSLAWLSEPINKETCPGSQHASRKEADSAAGNGKIDFGGISDIFALHSHFTPPKGSAHSDQKHVRFQEAPPPIIPAQTPSVRTLLARLESRTRAIKEKEQRGPFSRTPREKLVIKADETSSDTEEKASSSTASHTPSATDPACCTNNSGEDALRLEVDKDFARHLMREVAADESGSLSGTLSSLARSEFYSEVVSEVECDFSLARARFNAVLQELQAHFAETPKRTRYNNRKRLLAVRVLLLCLLLVFVAVTLRLGTPQVCTTATSFEDEYLETRLRIIEYETGV